MIKVRVSLELKSQLSQQRSSVTDATVISFEENQFVRLSLSHPLKSQADDISMRFRTRSTLSTLLTTSSRSAFEKLELSINDGQMELKFHIGQLKKVIKQSGQ